MNYQWNLDRIYKGFEDPAYTADMERMQQLVKEFTAFAESLPTIDPLEGLKTGVALREKLSELSSLFQYASLRSATDTKDTTPGSYMGRVMAMRSGLAAPMAAYNKWVVSLPNLMELVCGDAYLKDYEFMFSQMADSARYQLSAEAEAVAAKLEMSGGSAWAKLQGYLTSTVPVHYRGTVTNLSAIRNLCSQTS